MSPTSGTETVLYTFKGGADGSIPNGSLLNVNGVLYGTTSGGGASNGGTIFVMSPTSGTKIALHSFGSGADGSTPNGSLIDVNGTLYGTTYSGGANGYGTVFQVVP